MFTNQRDAQWATWTCVLGFNVMGVWQKYTDGTDINALCRWGGGWQRQGGEAASCRARAEAGGAGLKPARTDIGSNGTICPPPFLFPIRRSNRLAAFQEVDPLVGDGEYVVTASDDGKVRLFNYPCVVEEAPSR